MVHVMIDSTLSIITIHYALLLETILVIFLSATFAMMLYKEGKGGNPKVI